MPDSSGLLTLLMALTDHYRMDMGFLGSGTLGGDAIQKRMKAPKVGDFVRVSGILTRDTGVMGWLESIEPAEDGNPYRTVYQWKTLDGRTARYHNVEVTAIPVGNQWPKGGMLNNIDAFFQMPVEQRPKCEVSDA